MDDYKILECIGEGAHGLVLKALHYPSGDIVAIKKVALKRLDEGISCQALREIKSLQELQHKNIVELREVFPYGVGFVLVFEFMITDLGELIRDQANPMSAALRKAYMQQLLEGVEFMHLNNIMHRDLKPANLLISETGHLKIADFGQARLFFKEEKRPYSHQVATRWYRAPELLYGAKFYSETVDIWAVGCIFGEMINGAPLFPGGNDIEQVVIVFQSLGTPTEQTWPGLTDLPDYAKITFPIFSPVPFEKMLPNAEAEAIRLLSELLVLNPQERIAASKALSHRYFFSAPHPTKQNQLPHPRPKAKPSAKVDDADAWGHPNDFMRPWGRYEYKK